MLALRVLLVAPRRAPRRGLPKQAWLSTTGPSLSRSGRSTRSGTVNKLLERESRAEGVLRVVWAHAAADLSSYNIATAVHRVGKLATSRPSSWGPPLQEQWQFVLRRLEGCVGDLNGREVANVWYGFGRLAHPPDHSLAQALVQRSVEVGPSLEARHVANILWACSAFRPRPPPLPSTTPPSPPSPASPPSSPAPVHTPFDMPPVLAEALVQRLYQVVPAACPQSLSTSLWAFAHLADMHDTPTPPPSPSSPDGGPSLLSEPPISPVAKQQPCSGGATWPNDVAIAGPLWQLSHRPPLSLIDAIITRAAATAHHFAPQDVAFTLWALGMLRHKPSAALVVALHQRVEETALSLRPHELTMVVWGAAVLGLSFGNAVWGALRVRLHALLPVLTLKECAISLWGVCVQGQTGLDVVPPLWNRAQHHLRALTTTTTTNPQPPTATAATTTSHSPYPLRLLHRELGQLLQVWLSSERSAHQLEWHSPLLFHQALAVHRNTTVAPSMLQRDVARCLRDLGVACEMEALVGSLSVDFVLRVGDNNDGSGAGKRKVVVEVDGPMHFFRNSGREVVGRTAFKRVLLRDMGWEVVCVPYFEWNAAALLPGGTREYLRAKLQATGVCV